VNLHRRFVFLRHEDQTGISGVGLVVMGVQYPDERCHYRWLSENATDQMADSMDKIRAVHGHGGKTVVVFIDDEYGVPYPGVLRQVQALLENQS
jgi:hypothetical protein